MKPKQDQKYYQVTVKTVDMNRVYRYERVRSSVGAHLKPTADR